MSKGSIWDQASRSAHVILLPIGCVGILLVLTACAAPTKYTPTAKLTSPQPKTVTTALLPVTVHFGKLVDMSPTQDKEDGWLYGGGWSVTSPERLKGPLEVLLTHAIFGDLKRHGLFNDLTQENEAGRLRLDGKVHRFYQRREDYLWALCCGLLGAILPFPLIKEEGAVDIELTLIEPDGTPIQSYRGKSSFLERCNFYESRCWDDFDKSPAKYLDEALGESMIQIRKAIIGDKDLIIQRVSQGAK